MKHIIIFLLLTLLHVNTFAQSQLNEKAWRFIQVYCLEYLLKNKHNLKINTNESGFYRIKIPTPAGVNHNICDIRINYWNFDSNATLQKETLHNHPNYFESKIIAGWYEHELFQQEPASDKTSNYFCYTVQNIATKALNKKIVTMQSNVFIRSLGTQVVKKNQVLAVDKDLIHRITIFTPETLSINVVFAENGTKNSTYNIFLPKEVTDEPKINSRSVLADNAIKKNIINNLITILASK
jgi:hypothetical protein